MTVHQEDYTQLVQEDRVHSRVFTDNDIFEAEMERIFHRRWLFVGHESEVPEPGDYVVKWMGRHSVLLIRTREGDVTLLLNRCRHRGTSVCTESSGNASFFRCPYHGWTYSNDGTLAGVPYPSSYGDDFDKTELGLTKVPRMEVFQGFVFGSLSPTGVTLAEHLGPAAAVINQFVDASPEGRILVRSGCQKNTFRGNWKFVGMDGYHVNFTHKSVLDLERRMHGAAEINELFTDKSGSQTLDFGNGHVRLNTATGRQKEFAELLHGRFNETDYGREYLAMLAEVYGEDNVDEVILHSRDPHLGVWPNLQILGVHIRVIRPIAPNQTEVSIYPTMLAGAPEPLNEMRLRSNEWSYGSAGIFQPDDSEIFERSQIGLMNTVDPWMLLSRGLGREQVLEDGTIVGNITDEVTQRGQMRAWRAAMGEVSA